MKNLLLAISGLLALAGCQKSENITNLKDQQPQAETCSQQKAAGDGEVIDGQYIVAYNSIAGRNRLLARQVENIDASTLQRNSIGRTALLASFAGEPGGFVARLSAQEYERLKNDGEISLIEPDRVIALGNCFTVVEPRTLTWNIKKVGYGNGIGKVAWVIDTGIDFAHPDLTVDVTRSRSFLTGQASAADQNGHGTHVAGIIGGKNNSIGVFGVASGATMVSLRVLDKDGKGNVSSIIQALAYVSSVGAAGDAVNLSLGEDGVSDILDQQVRNTASKGIYISIAAGNEHKLANQSSPARVNAPNVYTVSAIDSTGKFASFSNFGNDVVDYAAPGVRILSTFMGNRYATMSGTSMAAPHVTGLLLLTNNHLNTAGVASGDPDGTADAIVHQ